MYRSYSTALLRFANVSSVHPVPLQIVVPSCAQLVFPATADEDESAKSQSAHGGDAPLASSPSKICVGLGAGASWRSST